MQLVASSRAYNFMIPPDIPGNESQTQNCSFHFEVDIHYMMPTYRGGLWRILWGHDAG
jgi:hypothetical protein